MSKESYVTFALGNDGGIEWYCNAQTPDLSAEEAAAIGINRAAGAMKDVAGAIEAVASAIERLAAAIENRDA